MPLTMDQKLHFLCASLALAVACRPVVPAGAPQSAPPIAPLIPPGAEPVVLAAGFLFTEGPAAAPNGDVYFTDQPNDRILVWRCASSDGLAGRIEVFCAPAGRANGMAFDVQGRLIVCADEHNELRALDVESGASRVLVRGFEGAAFNGPNDVWCHPSGALYFTDPYYQRPWWTRKTPELATADVYRLAPEAQPADPRREGGGRVLTRVATDFERPNGIIGTPDGRTLYVSDIGRGETWAFDVRTDGTLGERRLVARLGSDGMTLDERGHLYLTGEGVTVLDPSTGQVVLHIPVPESWTANVTFGGPDRRTLFITAKGALYGLRMGVRGAGA